MTLGSGGCHTTPTTLFPPENPRKQLKQFIDSRALDRKRKRRERLETYTREVREGKAARRGTNRECWGAAYRPRATRSRRWRQRRWVRVRTRNALVTIFGPGPCPGHRDSLRETRENGEKKAERRGEDNATPAVGSRGRDEKNEERSHFVGPTEGPAFVT